MANFIKTIWLTFFPGLLSDAVTWDEGSRWCCWIWICLSICLRVWYVSPSFSSNSDEIQRSQNVQPLLTCSWLPGIRLYNSRKLVPSGLLLALSLGALGVFYSAYLQDKVLTILVQWREFCTSWSFLEGLLPLLDVELWTYCRCTFFHCSPNKEHLDFSLSHLVTISLSKPFSRCADCYVFSRTKCWRTSEFSPSSLLRTASVQVRSTETSCWFAKHSTCTANLLEMEVETNHVGQLSCTPIIWWGTIGDWSPTGNFVRSSL